MVRAERELGVIMVQPKTEWIEQQPGHQVSYQIYVAFRVLAVFDPAGVARMEESITGLPVG
jgi:hypothetical protein